VVWVEEEAEGVVVEVGGSEDDKSQHIITKAQHTDCHCQNLMSPVSALILPLACNIERLANLFLQT
jgi:hypothetical protein